MNSEGKVTLPAARETVTFPSSNGWRMTSRVERLNSGSSSRIFAANSVDTAPPVVVSKTRVPSASPTAASDPARFWYLRIIKHISMLTRKNADYLAAELGMRLMQWTPPTHYGWSWRGKLVQTVQTFAYWQFRRRTLIARWLLAPLPFFTRLRLGDVAPTFTATRDHVLAVLRKD